MLLLPLPQHVPGTRFLYSYIGDADVRKTQGFRRVFPLWSLKRILQSTGGARTSDMLCTRTYQAEILKKKKKIMCMK